MAAEQNHIALIYRNDDSEPMLLHHGWHKDTRHHAWDGKYHSAQFQHLDIELQETFADWAIEVAPRVIANNIPYGVFYNLQANFGIDGKYIDRDDASGHTCATFLLDLFHSYGMPLLSLLSWPEERNGDLQWQQKMLDQLFNDRAITREVTMQQYWLKLRRFRPEEVASAAVLYVDAPLPFDDVQNESESIARQLSTT
ncbi:hypothetical protein [Paracidovorax anthurii]|uniref:hypothetical protein n=1 Tax=Paracidovorax anthurii TaxID=78229 RepID=UPI0039EE8BA2